MGKKNNNYYIFALYNALSTLYKCASQLTLGHQLYDPSAFEFLDGCSIAEFSLNPLSLTSYENAYRDCAAKKHTILLQSCQETRLSIVPESRSFEVSAIKPSDITFNPC